MNNYLPELPPESTIYIENIPLKSHVIGDGVWLLTDMQVAMACDIAVPTVRRHFSRCKDKLIEGSDWFWKHGKLPPRFPRLRLWTRDGLIKIGAHILTSEASSLLNALGANLNRWSKVESEFTDVIQAVFNNVFPVKFHYKVSNYKVDIYFSTLNLAVEIDEFNHEGYSRNDEKIREATIKEHLGCEMLRFNPNLPGNNVYKLLNIILKLAKISRISNRL